MGIRRWCCNPHTVGFCKMHRVQQTPCGQVVKLGCKAGWLNKLGPPTMGRHCGISPRATRRPVSLISRSCWVADPCCNSIVELRNILGPGLRQPGEAEVINEERSCLRLLCVPGLVGRCALFHSEMDAMTLASQAGPGMSPDRSMYTSFSASKAKMEATEFPGSPKEPSLS